MNKIVNYRFLCSTISITLAVIYCLLFLFVSYNASNTIYKLIVVNNTFYMVSSDGIRCYIYAINSNGEAELASSEKIPFTDIFYGYRGVYLYGSDREYTSVTDCSSGNIIGILEDIHIKNNCITSDSRGIIYVVDMDSPSCVVRINLINNRILGTIDTGRNINALFASKTSGNVFALTDTGICEVDSGNFIFCDVPQIPFEVSDSYCTDSFGNVYTFNDMNGFEKIMSTGYSKVQVLDEAIYVCSGNEILRLDSSGNPTAKCSFNQGIDDMCTGINGICILCGGSTGVVSKNAFEPIEQQLPVTEPSNGTTNHIDSDTQGNPNYSTEKSYDISSDTYQLENGLIKNIPAGTTVAELRKHMEYGDNSISFINHNGKTVTSGQIGTGWTVTFSGGGKTQSFLTVIRGELTGEGNINSRDYDVISDYLVKLCTLNEAQIVAADTNNDSRINCTDAVLILKGYG